MCVCYRLSMLPCSIIARAALSESIVRCVREAPLNFSTGSNGHCPNSDCTPSLSVNRALWGTLFSDRNEQLCQISVLMVISAPNHPGKHFGPLHNKAITHLNFNFHCISAPTIMASILTPPQSSKLPIWFGAL